MSSNFDRADFRVRYRRKSPDVIQLRWPVAPGIVLRLGDSVTADRDGHGRPHRGIDIFAPALSPVVSASEGQVARVVDGRGARLESLRRAGLFVDVVGPHGMTFRYLHLGSASVARGQRIEPGAAIGVIALPHTSGLGSEPHLHFEVRKWDVRRGTYGPELDPLRILPPLRV